MKSSCQLRYNWVLRVLEKKLFVIHGCRNFFFSFLIWKLMVEVLRITCFDFCRTCRKTGHFSLMVEVLRITCFDFSHTCWKTGLFSLMVEVLRITWLAFSLCIEERPFVVDGWSSQDQMVDFFPMRKKRPFVLDGCSPHTLSHIHWLFSSLMENRPLICDNWSWHACVMLFVSYVIAY